MNWSALFGIHTPVLELLIRGSSMYWFLFLMFRFILRRDIGAVGIADVLLVVIIADAAQNAMAGGYTTITEGFVLVATIIGWNVLLDWLAYHLPVVARLAQAPPLLLVHHGRMLKRNLRKEFITAQELQSQLRQEGVEDIRQVKEAWMEGDGTISVIKVDSKRQ